MAHLRRRDGGKHRQGGCDDRRMAGIGAGMAHGSRRLIGITGMIRAESSGHPGAVGRLRHGRRGMSLATQRRPLQDESGQPQQQGRQASQGQGPHHGGKIALSPPGAKARCQETSAGQPFCLAATAAWIWPGSK